MTSEGSGVLLAVLLNPPGRTPGTRSRNAIEMAARLLGYDSFEIVNLCSDATPTVVELNKLGHGPGWQDARQHIAEALRRTDGLLAGWGVTGLTGDGRRALVEQVAWLSGEASAAGIERVWMVGGEPRHPSRWHQYLSDKHGRTSGGSIEQRLNQVLEAVPLARGWGSRERPSGAA